jgi:hypothetical protein
VTSSKLTLARTPEKEIKKQTVALIELYFWRKGEMPTQEDLDAEFLEGSNIELTLSDPRAVTYLLERGVPVQGTASITPKQLRWIRAILDPNDFRPWTIKLRGAAVTQAEHEGWMRQRLFTTALREEANKLLEVEKSQIISALNKRAQTGDVRAIRLALELTGDLNVGGGVPKQDVAQMMRGILEILQMHVPREILLNLQDDFEYLLTHGIVRQHLNRPSLNA